MGVALVVGCGVAVGLCVDDAVEVGDALALGDGAVLDGEGEHAAAITRTAPVKSHNTRLRI
jgi:hypothetical protein